MQAEGTPKKSKKFNKGTQYSKHLIQHPALGIWLEMVVLVIVVMVVVLVGKVEYLKTIEVGGACWQSFLVRQY